MAIQIDTHKLVDIVKSLDEDVDGCCCAASHYVGKLGDKVVKITVMDAREAQDDGYDDSFLTPLIMEH